MEQIRRAILKDDVFSFFKYGKSTYRKYGTAGDRVIIISDRRNVMIVEAKDGSRYPVETNKLIFITKHNSK